MISRKTVAIRATYISIAGNILLALIKGITGILGNSFALIADAVESTTDIFSSALVLFGLRYATKPPDDDHPYGHGRAEPLITFAVVGFLVASASYIMFQGIRNIGQPQATPESYTLYVLGGIIILKEIYYRIILKKSKMTESTALQADAWHHRSDAITSLIAFIGISVALIMGEEYAHADDVAAMLASCFIIYNAYRIFRPALGEVMDENLHEAMISEIREIARTVNGIKDTEKCLVRKAGMHYFVDLHAIVDGSLSVKEGHTLAHQLKDRIREKLPEVADVLVHIEPA